MNRRAELSPSIMARILVVLAILAFASSIVAEDAVAQECPTDPYNLQASFHCPDLFLQWTAAYPPSGVSYQVARDSAGTFINIGGVQTTTNKTIPISAPYLIHGTSVSFIVFSYPPPGPSCETGQTNIVSVFIDAPTNPTELYASVTSSGQVQLFWWPPNPNAVYDLRIFRDNETNPFVTVPYSIVGYTFTETVCAPQHVYKVQAAGSNCVVPATVSASPLPTPLAVPTNLVPAQGAEVVAQNLVLSWASMCSATSYYYEVSANSNFSPLLAQGTVTQTQSGPLTGLPVNVPVYWRVTSCNSGGCLPAWSVSHFFIPNIVVTAPNGGENWAPGSQQQIAWQGIGTVSLDLSADGGVSWTNVGTAAASPATITVPSAWASTKVLARVTRTAAPLLSDQSNATFRVVPASVQNWGIYSIDNSAVRGEWAAMTTDNSGALVTAYRDQTNGDLLLATRTGTTWGIELIESAGDVGYGASIAFDSQNRPHVAYLDGNSYLRYAYRSGGPGVWTTMGLSVGPSYNFYRTSIALDTADRPYILGRTYGLTANLMHLLQREEPTSGNWSTEYSGPGAYHALMRLAGDLPRISYVNGNGQLRLVSGNSGGSSTWPDSLVASNAAGSHSLVLGASFLPSIAYMTTGGQLRYTSQASGGTWSNEPVDVSGGQTGTHISLAFHAGAPRVAYEANNLLKFARRDGSVWSTDVVDASGHTGEYCSLRMSSIDTPWITYYDAVAGKLRFAIAPNDITLPGSIGLGGVRGKTTSMLTWTAPGDDGSVGTAIAYEIRRSTAPFTVATFSQAELVATPAPQPAGSSECQDFFGLSPCQPYWYGIRVFDDAGNSSTSNILQMTQRCSGNTEYACTYSMNPVADAAPAEVEHFLESHPSIGSRTTHIEYGVPARSAGQSLRIAAYDLEGRLIRTLVNTVAATGRFDLEWDQRSDAGVRVASGIYFVRYDLDSESITRRVPVLR